MSGDVSQLDYMGKAGDERRLFSYTQLVHRSTEDVSEYIESIRQVDKDALIVVFGDHSPLFWQEFSMYWDAGLIVHDKQDLTVDELLTLYSTPIVVIDGINGGVKPTIKNMYELPSMIVNMLSCYRGACKASDSGPPHHARPINGRGVLYYKGDGCSLCGLSDSAPDCLHYLHWGQLAKLVRNDLIMNGH